MDGMQLAQYLADKKITTTAFGKLIGKSHASVSRYARKKRMPRPNTIRRIHKATDGEVSFEDWYADETAEAAE